MSSMALSAVALWPVPASAGAGPQTFSTHCAMCHQSDGAGLPGQFPRLAGRLGPIAASPEGRQYLISVLLYGMYGKIMVDGQTVSGLMPAMGMLSDQETADVLNHSVNLKKPAKKVPPFTAAEVGKIRAGAKRSGTEMAAERARLAGKNLIP